MENNDAANATIGLLLPESKTTRYESYDRPLFEAKIKDLCADCKVVYSNADQDAAKQQQQAESALTQGVKVLVLDPVDATAAASIVASAKAQDVPVISYDRLVNGDDLAFYVSFDNEKVGNAAGHRPWSTSSRPMAPRRRHPHGQRLADRQQRRRCSRRARTASSTAAASTSWPSSTRPTGAPTRPRSSWPGS